MALTSLPSNTSPTSGHHAVRCTYSWAWYLAFGVELVVAALMLRDFGRHLGTRDLGQSAAFGSVIILLMFGILAFLLSPWQLTLERETVVGRYLLQPRRAWPASALVINRKSGLLSAGLGGYAVKNREGRIQFVVWPQLRNLDALIERLSEPE